MLIKRTIPVTFLFTCFIIFAIVSSTSASASASNGSSSNDAFIIDKQTDTEESVTDKKSAMSIIHESVDILCYEDGSPYIHDILTNNTDKAIIETQYGMLAYDEKGSPLKLYWNFLDSSSESSYDNVVLSKENILPGQTEQYCGGWSLYDGEIMKDFPKVGDGGANHVAYSLICLKQVVFEDGTVWNNPDYESWSVTYAGKEIGVEELQTYYPHQYEILSGDVE